MDTTNLVRVNQGATCRVKFTVKDHDGVFIPVANIASAVLTVYDLDTMTTITGADAVDILPYIDIYGECVYHLAPAINTMINETKTIERHVVYVVITGVGQFAPVIVEEAFIDVKNTKRIVS